MQKTAISDVFSDKVGSSGENRTPSNLGPKPSAIPLGDTPEYEIAVLALPVLLPIIIADFCGKVNDFWGKIYRRRLPASAASAAGLRGIRAPALFLRFAFCS